MADKPTSSTSDSDSAFDTSLSKPCYQKKLYVNIGVLINSEVVSSLEVVWCKKLEFQNLAFRFSALREDPLLS